MTNLFNILFNKNWSACLYCSAIRCTGTCLCESCWSQLEQAMTKTQVGRDGLQVSSLWIWKSETIHNKLAYKFKNTLNPQFWQRLAELTLAKSGRSLDSKYDVFIPAPPRVTGQQDHAYLYANALSSLTGVKVLTVLNRGTDISLQKQLARSERLKRRLRVSQIPSNFSCLRPIFVDDVLTTGGTAMAAREALSVKGTLEVWTLYCRERRGLV